MTNAYYCLLSAIIINNSFHALYFHVTGCIVYDTIDTPLVPQQVLTILEQPDVSALSQCCPSAPKIGQVFVLRGNSRRDVLQMLDADGYKWEHKGRKPLPRKCPTIIKTYQSNILYNLDRWSFELPNDEQHTTVVQYLKGSSRNANSAIARDDKRSISGVRRQEPEQVAHSNENQRADVKLGTQGTAVQQQRAGDHAGSRTNAASKTIEAVMRPQIDRPTVATKKSGNASSAVPVAATHSVSAVAKSVFHTAKTVKSGYIHKDSTNATAFESATNATTLQA